MKTARLRLGPDGFAALRCLLCRAPLALHQPTEGLPERLIGVCPHYCDGCGSWHVIDLLQGGSDAVIVLLPPSTTLRDTCRSQVRRRPES